MRNLDSVVLMDGRTPLSHFDATPNSRNNYAQRQRKKVWRSAKESEASSPQ